MEEEQPSKKRGKQESGTQESKWRKYFKKEGGVNFVKSTWEVEQDEDWERFNWIW